MHRFVVHPETSFTLSLPLSLSFSLPIRRLARVIAAGEPDEPNQPVIYLAFKRHRCRPHARILHGAVTSCYVRPGAPGIGLSNRRMIGIASGMIIQLEPRKEDWKLNREAQPCDCRPLC